MADFEKVYSINFKVERALKNLERLDTLLERIEKNKLAKVLGKIEKGLRDVEQQSKKTSRSIDKAFGTRARQKVDRLSKSTGKASKNMRRLSKDTAATSISLQRLGTNLNRFVLLPLAAISAASIKAAFDMNKGMSSVATLIPGQTARIKELKTGIQDLAMETGTATGDLTAGAYAAVSAWGDSADTLDRLRVVAKAAKAGLATTDETLGLLASLTEIFGDNSKEATERLADLAFVTNKLAIKAPFADMANSMGKVAPLAKQIGLSQEELFATLGAVSGVSGNVAEVSTQMSSLYTSLIKETPAMSKVVEVANKKLGKSFGTAGEMMSEMGTLPFLKFLKENTEGSKGLSKALGGRKEGLVLALTLAGSRSGKYNEIMKEMTSNSGQMEIAFNEVANGINKEGHAFEQTKQRFIVFAQRLGDKLLPVLSKLMASAEPFLQMLEGMDTAAFENVITMGKLAVQIALIAKAMSAMDTLGTAVIGLLGGIGAEASGSVGGVNALAGSMRGFIGALGLAAGAYYGLIAARDAWEQSSGVSEREAAQDDLAYAAVTPEAMTDAQLKDAIAQESQIQKNLPTSDLGASFESPGKLAQTFISNFDGDVERPMEEANRRRSESINQQAKFKAELRGRQRNAETASLAADYGSQRGGISGFDPFAGVNTTGGQKQVTIGDTTIHIDGAQDPAAVAKQVKRELDKRDRNALVHMRAVNAGVGTGEQ